MSAVQQLEDYPPAVTFEEWEIEDRDATIRDGEFVGKPVIMAIIVPANSKDKIERVYDDWIKQLRGEVKKDRFPLPWFQAIQKNYQAWVDDVPAPSFGTPISTWKHATPQLRKACNANNIHTIEELAEVDVEQYSRLGKTFITLHNKALKYVNQEKIEEDEDD